MRNIGNKPSDRKLITTRPNLTLIIILQLTRGDTSYMPTFPNFTTQDKHGPLEPIQVGGENEEKRRVQVVRRL